MRLALLLVALAAIVQGIQAQSTATVYVLSSTDYGSANWYMSTSFVGLRLPSGGGSVSITIAPGDLAANEFVTSYADQTQEGPYASWGSSTSFTISSTGKYWVYLSQNAQGTPSNYDWLEIRVEASNYGSTPTCYYCSPPSGWASGWPPYGSPQLIDNSPAPVASVIPGSAPKETFTRVPNWVIAVLSVVIGLAVLLPTSYFVYRRVTVKAKPTAPVVSTQGNTETSTPTQSQVEMQHHVAVATAV